MDAFKSLLIRFETSARNWLNLNLIGLVVIFARDDKQHFRQFRYTQWFIHVFLRIELTLTQFIKHSP